MRGILVQCTMYSHDDTMGLKPKSDQNELVILYKFFLVIINQKIRTGDGGKIWWFINVGMLYPFHVLG